MLKSSIDHLVITSSTRASGSMYVTDKLGVSPQIGGEHPHMGTHNALLRLGDSIYLEVISPNPTAVTPERPRWFGLDQISASGFPRLATWIVRTNDIRGAAQRSAVSLGNIEWITRNALAWLITIPPDGSLPLDGAAPSLIEWSTTFHPAGGLPDSGCSLERLQIRSPQSAMIETFLREVGFDGPVEFASPLPNQASGLVAWIRTPKGLLELC